MEKIEKFKGGRHQMMTLRHKERFKDGGKLCYGCKKVRKLEEYSGTSSRCKHCQNSRARKLWEIEKKSMW